MGCRFSCVSPASSSEPAEIINKVRVVHLNGFVQDFDDPVSVRQVTGRMPLSEFVCTPSQLLSFHSKPLKLDTLLEPGHIYLVLPFSALHADLSPVDLAAIARKLTAKAKSVKSGASNYSKSPRATNPLPCRYGSSPARCPPAMGPRRLMDPAVAVSCGAQRSQWRPILDTIREKSFSRSSEWDLNLEEKEK